MTVAEYAYTVARVAGRIWERTPGNRSLVAPHAELRRGERDEKDDSDAGVRELPNYPRDWHFSPGLDTGDFVFFSGITGTRPDLSIAKDSETQFRQAFGGVTRQ